MRISDWSSDVCSSDLVSPALRAVIDCADNAQVLISRHEEAVVVRPNEMFLTARGMTIVDRMKSIRHATELLAQCGLSADDLQMRSEEHTSELQSLMRPPYAVFCSKKKTSELHSKNRNTEGAHSEPNDHASQHANYLINKLHT